MGGIFNQQCRLIVPLLPLLFLLYLLHNAHSSESAAVAKEHQQQQQNAHNGNAALPMVLTAEQRKQLRVQAEAAVEKINKSQKKWNAKIDQRFAELTNEEMRRFWLGSAEDTTGHAKAKAERAAGRLEAAGLDKKKRTTTTTTTASPEPEEDAFDAREEWPECADVIGKIQDQSKCGSCWAVSAASVMQDRICIASKGQQKVDISAGHIISCEPFSNGCNGGLSSYAFQFYHTDGIVTGSNYTLQQGCKPYPIPPHADHSYKTPRCKKHCANRQYKTKYAKDKHFGEQPVEINHGTVDDIKDAIFEGGIRGGTVETHIDVYDDFKHYSSGVYERSEDSEYLGGHAVRIVGWGVDKDNESGEPLPYWLIANSWGTDWGENGFFRIARGQDECFVESYSVNYADPKQDDN